MKALIISMLISFATTLFIIPYAIRYFKFIGLVTTDVHKKRKPLVPYSAGMPVMAGIIMSLLFYIFLNVFIYHDSNQLTYFFAALTSILIISFSGLMDDLNSRQVKVAGYVEGKRGLKNWQKPLLTIPAALPLMAIMAGNTTMSIPLIGSVNFGIFYPLLIVPIGVVGAANMVNMLGGFNGLEAGMGAVYTLSLGIFSYIHGEMTACIIFLTTFASLIAALKYNFFPAKILPGDSLTYILGAVVATGAIVGNIEKATVITMMPFIIQGILKFYGLYKIKHFPSDMGILQKDGSIKSKYGNKIYSLTHVFMNLGNFTEKQIVIALILVQVFFSSLIYFIM
jgi:UDP-N-acetylglucosamine--dolichyl-phosphate N-acetylglucosaminephosphotransferase